MTTVTSGAGARRMRSALAAASPARPAPPKRLPLSPRQALALPLVGALALASFGLSDGVGSHPRLLWAFLGAAAGLALSTALLARSVLASHRPIAIEVAPRPQHYVQACAQASVLAYWGWYWPEVYASVPLVAAQLLFAYVVDLLINWSRRDTYTLGFGPFPVVFSINLFLWFREDWFFLQFLMVAVGFAAKELLRWNRDGRRVHIFNPSAFTLALFSAGLIATGTSDITWGHTIAVTQFYPPQMYLMLFLVSLPGQLLFGVASMTMAAVAATYGFGLVYFAFTGVYYFYDSYIPIAVFLGMLLLFTDPSTAPRTELGRLVFGALYGLSTVLLFDLLGRAGLPTFYDKLLQVPLLNLSVRLIDRVARGRALAPFDPAALGRDLPHAQRHLAYASVWTMLFAGLSLAQGVGDRHPGQWLPFWQEACAAGRPRACAFLTARQTDHCDGGSGWACNEAGLLRAAAAGPGTRSEEAVAAFDRGCGFGFVPACGNLLKLADGAHDFESAPPTLDDYPIVLRGSKQPVANLEPAELYALACSQGWPGTCDPDAPQTGAAGRH
jgi:hypothetical protein